MKGTAFTLFMLDKSSSFYRVICGVLQGSVLVPILFTVYMYLYRLQMLELLVSMGLFFAFMLMVLSCVFPYVLMKHKKLDISKFHVKRVMQFVALLPCSKSILGKIPSPASFCILCMCSPFPCMSSLLVL